MSDEPTYPKDAAVGAQGTEQRRDEAAEPAAQADKAGEARRKKYVTAGVAVGIGSAAIVAALLYANRGKREGEKGGS